MYKKGSNKYSELYHKVYQKCSKQSTTMYKKGSKKYTKSVVNSVVKCNPKG